MRPIAKPFRIGILGGMGPLAGVELHRLIIEATPATKDQEHLQIMLFTNPAIPDRTESLQKNDGTAFAAVAGESARELEKAGVDVILLACMTAHSRLMQIQAKTKVPILSGIPLVHTALTMHFPKAKVALLATPGSIRSGVYTRNSPMIDWMLPEPETQTLVTDAIYKIKAGHIGIGTQILKSAIHTLGRQGATVFILGCTELGLLYAELQEQNVTVIDPMRLMAHHVVLLSQLMSTPQPQGSTKTQIRV